MLIRLKCRLRTRRLLTFSFFFILWLTYRKYGQPVRFGFIHHAVNTTCVLPDLDPFDKSVKKYLYDPDPIVCDPSPSLVYVDFNGALQINTTLLKTPNRTNIHCSYRHIERKGENDIDFAPFVHIKGPVKLSSDLVHVKCKTTVGVIFDKILFNVDSDSLLKRKAVAKESNERLSLFIFGYDSVSRLAALRKTPKTMDFIKYKLGGFTFNGYTMIGGSTYPNLIAVTTGKKSSGSELPKLDLKMQYTDQYPFIWKNFSGRNYVTMYSEDFPEISIFANNMAGFNKPPCDHYTRTYYIAQKKMNFLHTNIESFKILMYLEDNQFKLGKYSPFCYQNKPKHVLHMDHYKQFLDRYKGYAKFAFSWLTELSHDYYNFFGLTDNDNKDFFKYMKDSGHLQNAVLVFMSDHGSRNDEIRNTAAGRIEERMPLLSIVIPETLQTRYPHIVQNLKENQRRLTSPFDLYETLVDILNNDFSEKSIFRKRPYPRGISLFRRIPKDRTCNDAGIAEHYCACYTAEKANVTSKKIMMLANYAVQSVNAKLSQVQDVCSKLSLHKILEAQKIQSGIRHNAHLDRQTIYNLFYRPEEQKEERYLIVFQTFPGLGKFEATISFTDLNDSNSFKILGDFSRTNKYRNQSHCVHRQQFKHICYCKVQG